MALYNQLVGADQIVGMDPDAQALIGAARIISGATAANALNLASLFGHPGMRPAPPPPQMSVHPSLLAALNANNPGFTATIDQSLIANGQASAQQQANLINNMLVAQQKAQQAQQLAQQIGDPVVVQPQDCLQARRLPAGFESLAVGAGLSVTITVRPQVLFKAERLVIPYTGNGEFFSILSFNIGQTNLLVGSGPVPAGIFAENATGMIQGLGLPTNQPVQEINLVFRNNNAAAKDIRGAFEGRAVFLIDDELGHEGS